MIRVARTASPGSPVVVLYHAGASAAVLAAVPSSWGIVSETYPGFQDHYTHLGADAITPMPDVLAAAGASPDAPVVLVGFSEGCQGVRTQLLAGVEPSAVLAVDGIHAQTEAWRTLVLRARRGEAKLTVTHSSIEPGSYPSTTATAAVLESFRGTDDYPLTSVYEDGGLRILGFAGTDAAAHIFQGTVVLPNELARIAEGALPAYRSSFSLAGPILGAASAFAAFALLLALDVFSDKDPFA